MNRSESESRLILIKVFLSLITPLNWLRILANNGSLAALEVVSIYVFYKVISLLSEGQSLSDDIGIFGFEVSYRNLIFGAITAQVLLFSFRIITFNHNMKMSQGLRAELTVKLLRKLLFGPFAYLKSANKDELTKNSLNDTDILMNSFVLQIFNLITASLSAVGIIGYFFFHDLQSTLVLIVSVAGVYTSLLLYFKTKMNNLSVDIDRLNSDRYRRVGEIFRNYRFILQSLNHETHFNELSKSLHAFADKARQFALITILPRYVLELAFIVGFLILIVFGNISLNQDNTGSLAAFIYGMLRLIPYGQTIYSSINTIRMTKPIRIKILETLLLQTKPRVVPKEFCSDVIVELSDLSFRTQETVIINELSFDIRKNKKYFLSGPSGSGKSTLMELIAGLSLATSGTISISREVFEEGKIQYVPQKPILFDKSVYFNITQKERISDGNTDLLFEELVGLMGLLDELNDTQLYNNNDADRRETLSGGQIQRIALCRALYAKPDLLLLDEATSGVDEQRERQIIEKICSKNIAIICVSHRAELRKYFDHEIQINSCGTVLR